MANKKHVNILKQGVDVWNQWRSEHPDIRPDLTEAKALPRDLNQANLSKVYFYRVDLMGYTLMYANLSKADLVQSRLHGANFFQANFTEAELNGADLSSANLTQANLSKAFLAQANFSNANLNGADLSDASIFGTIFAYTDLSQVKGLETVRHGGPSTIGIDTIYRSQANIPEAFLKGAGVDDNFIAYIRSLVGKAIEYYSCFISYSSKDEAFAKRLHADLQNNNVRCWFAPEDMKIGDKFWHSIDESIWLYDKLLVVLSQHSVESEWVEREVIAALEKERQQQKLVLLPITLDDAFKHTFAPWAADLRRQRHIGDFTLWKTQDDYQKAFIRLLRDLKVGG